jgi:hypothetical protein
LVALQEQDGHAALRPAGLAQTQCMLWLRCVTGCLPNEKVEKVLESVDCFGFCACSQATNFVHRLCVHFLTRLEPSVAAAQVICCIRVLAITCGDACCCFSIVAGSKVNNWT